MKNIIKLLLLVTVISVQSCSNEKNCEDYLCNTPPSPFLFEIVDKTTGENLFTNDTYQPEQIELVYLSDNTSNLDFTFFDENNVNIIQINSIGWKTEQANILVKISDDNIFNLFIYSPVYYICYNNCIYYIYYYLNIPPYYNKSYIYYNTNSSILCLMIVILQGLHYWDEMDGSRFRQT